MAVNVSKPPAFEDLLFQQRITQSDHTLRRSVVEEEVEEVPTLFHVAGEGGGVPLTPGPDETGFEESDHVGVCGKDRRQLSDVIADVMDRRIGVARVVPLGPSKP